MSLPIPQRPKKPLPIAPVKKKKKSQKDLIDSILKKEFNDKEYWKDHGFCGKDYNLFS